MIDDDPERLDPAQRPCSCEGCEWCPGHEPGCTCDIDWEEVFGQ